MKKRIYKLEHTSILQKKVDCDLVNTGDIIDVITTGFEFYKHGYKTDYIAMHFIYGIICNLQKQTKVNFEISGNRYTICCYSQEDALVLSGNIYEQIIMRELAGAKKQEKLISLLEEKRNGIL